MHFEVKTFPSSRQTGPGGLITDIFALALFIVGIGTVHARGVYDIAAIAEMKIASASEMGTVVFAAEDQLIVVVRDQLFLAIHLEQKCFIGIASDKLTLRDLVPSVVRESSDSLAKLSANQN